MKTLIRCLLTKGSLKKNGHDEYGYDGDDFNNSAHLSCHSVPVSNKSYGGCSSRTAATSTHSLAVSNHTVGTQGLLNSVHGVGIVGTTTIDDDDDEEQTIYTATSTKINDGNNNSSSHRKKKTSRRKNRNRQDHHHTHNRGRSNRNNCNDHDDPSLLSYGLLKLMAKKGQWNELQRILLREEENEKENEPSHQQPHLYVVGHTYASNGDTFLHMVCRYHPPVELIEYLLNQRSKELATREVNHLGQTPLHVASASGASRKVIELLLQANPQIASMQDTKGNTPLHLHLIHTSHEKVCDPGLQHNIIIAQHSNEPCSHEEKRKEVAVVQADDLSEPDDVLVHMHHTLNTAVAKTSSFRKHNHPSIGKDDKTYKPSIKRSNLKKTAIKKAPTCVASSSASVGDTSSYSKKYDITISNKKFFKRCKNKKVGRKDSIKSIMEAFHEKQRKEGIPIVVVSPEDEEHYYDSCSDNGISSEHQHHNKGTVTMTEEDYLLYHSKQQLNSSSKEKFSLDDDPLFPRVALVKKIHDGRKKCAAQGNEDCSNINPSYCDADVTEKHQCYHQNKREHEMTDLQVMKKNNKLLVTGPNEDIVRSLVESSTSCLVVENDDGFTVIELAILNDAEYKMVVELQKYSRSFLRQRQRQERRKKSKAAAAAASVLAVATAVGHHPNRSDDNRTLQAALSESSMQSAASAPSSFNSKIPIHKTEDSVEAGDKKPQIKTIKSRNGHDAATTKSMSYACRRMRQAHTHVRHQQNDDESMDNNHLSSSVQAYLPSSSSPSSSIVRPRVYHNAAA